jgi:hypothetical protein
MAEENNEEYKEMSSSDGSKILIKGSHEDLEKIKTALLTAQSVDKANTQLLEENAELKGDLETIAEQRLNEKTRQYGINQDLSEEEKIAQIKEIEGKYQNRIDEKAFWANKNATYDTKIIDKGEGYDSVEDMILDLNRKAKSNDAVESAESQAVLHELGKKAMKKPLNIELESPLRTMARRPRCLETEKLEDYQKRLDDWKKTQKWKNIGED